MESKAVRNEKGGTDRPSARPNGLDKGLCGTAETEDLGDDRGNKGMTEDERQELQTWHDFDKWLKEVALGEEQYKVLMAEFYKDYKGITKHADSTYTSNEDEIKCANCKRRMDLWKYDYGKGGCIHEKMEGFACLGFAHEGEVIHMVGTEGSGCEMFAPKEVTE